LAKKHSHSTYLASSTKELERQVVLVVFNSSLFSFPYEHEYLLQKAKCIKMLQCQHIVPILDMGIEEEQPFVVYEYLPNGSLRSRLKRPSLGRLELKDALTIVSQVGEALAYAHEHNILHGNLKPENILFDANGQSALTDFYLMSGIANLIRDQATEKYAFSYIAPEQFVGICDAKSDQYALGCLTYELITGHVPFAEQSLDSIIRRPHDAQPAPLSESTADLPLSLEAAVFKTLAKDPDKRFFDFSLFLDVIRSFLSPPPAFPLSRSTHSRIKKTISRPTRLKREEDVASPITPNAAHSSSTHQAQALFPALKSSEEAMPKIVNDSLTTEDEMSEEAKAIFLPESQEAALPSSLSENADPTIRLEDREDVASSIIPSAASSSYAPQTLEFFPILGITAGTMPKIVDSSLVSEGEMTKEVRALLLLELQKASFPFSFSGDINPVSKRKDDSPNRSLKTQENNMFSATKFEAIAPLESSPSELGMAVQDTTTFWLTNVFMEQEVDKPHVGAPISSIYEQSEDATEMTPLLARSSVVHGPWTGLIWHGRRRRFGLVLLSLVIITILATYAAFLPFRISQPVRVSRSDTLPHPTQVVTQTYVSLIQTLPTPMPTVQPTTPVRIISPRVPSPTPIPLLPVSLSSYVNNKGIGNAPGQANLDGSGYSYPASQLPQASQITLNAVPYLFSGSATGANDNVVALGQTINFPQGNYQQAFLLVTSTWGSTSGMVTVNYTDGSTSSASLNAPDWLSGPSGVLSTSYRYSSTGIDKSVSYIYSVQIGIDGTKMASSLTLPSTAQPQPNQPSLHVFALTLQHI
jgi:serine/threonine protein kinase